MLPVFRRLMMVGFIRRRTLRGQQQRRTAETLREVARIRRALKSGDGVRPTTVIIVYDNVISPPTYGDYLLTVMAGRYFAAHGLAVEFYIVDSGHRHDWVALDARRREEFVLEQVEIADALLGRFEATVHRLDWKSVQRRLAEAEADRFVYFRERAESRRAIYGDSFNTLNFLLEDCDDTAVGRFLLSELDSPRSTELPERYVTLHCRHSEWGKERNTSDDEFAASYRCLRERYPDRAVMVLSDSIGYTYFKSVAATRDLPCLFSKDFSGSFLGDAKILLDSDFYFQMRGGGMGVVAMCSTIPFEIHSVLTNESTWTPEKATSWQTPKQVFIRL